jgi:hypothetical protein
MYWNCTHLSMPQLQIYLLNEDFHNDSSQMWPCAPDPQQWVYFCRTFLIYSSCLGYLILWHGSLIRP